MMQFTKETRPCMAVGNPKKYKLYDAAGCNCHYNINHTTKQQSQAVRRVR